jgi:hypothetical protein
MRFRHKILIGIVLISIMNFILDTGSASKPDYIVLPEKPANPNSNKPYNVTKPTKPVEMGGNVELELDFSSFDNISSVIIEYNGKNYTMEKFEKKSSHSIKKPNTLGEFRYLIHIQYLNQTWEVYEGVILIQDTIKPNVHNKMPSTKVLSNRKDLIFEIDASDSGSGISLVFLEIEGKNYTMENVEDEIFRSNEWIPSDSGSYSYSVYVIDVAGNVKSLQSSINIQIESPPETLTSSSNTGHSNPTESQSTGLPASPSFDHMNLIYIGIMFGIIFGFSLLVPGVLSKKRSQPIRPKNIENGSISLSDIKNVCSTDIQPNPHYTDEAIHYTPDETIKQYRKMAEDNRIKKNYSLSHAFELLANKLETNLEKRENLIHDFKMKVENNYDPNTIKEIATDIIDLSERLNDYKIAEEYREYLKKINPNQI